MKTIKLLLLVIGIAVFLGCDDDDCPVSGLEGSWKLIRTGGGIAGVQYDFAPGVITWDFDTASHTVHIVNNNTDDNAYDVFETGTYSYSFEPNTTTELCDHVLVINSFEQGCYMITSAELTIAEQVADGFTLQLIR